MKVVPLQAARQNLHKPHLLHLLLDRWVVTDVVEDVEAHEEQFVLLPDQHIEFFQLRLGCDPIILVVAPPHLDVLAVEQIESLDLVLQHFHDGGAHLVLGQQILELLVVGQYVEDAEDVD